MPCCRFTASFLDCSRCKCISSSVYMAASNIKCINHVDSAKDLQGSALQKASDTALGIALCLHSHIHINSVLSDYVPKSTLGMSVFIFHSLMCLTPSQLPTMCPLAAGATRIGALGVTGIAILGLTKLNLAGPGLTPTVKKLWTAPPAQ